MGAHSGNRIAERGAILNAQTVYRIRVVAAPDLGGVIEHTAVKAAAPAAAPLNEHIGEIPAQTLCELIYAQDIAMINFSLPVRRQSGGPHFSEAPVHVPFQIRDIGAGQDRLDLLIYMIPHIPP